MLISFQLTLKSDGSAHLPNPQSTYQIQVSNPLESSVVNKHSKAFKFNVIAQEVPTMPAAVNIPLVIRFSL